jgi:ATP-dependent Lhr-like helicase
MELGIDIGHIDYVVQYMSPRQVVRLVQRIGRSGHKLGGVSRGSIIVTRNIFQLLEAIVLVRRALYNQIEEERIEEAPLDVLAYAVALLTLILNEVDLYDLYSKLVEHILYEKLDIQTYLDLIEYLEYARIVKRESNFLKPMRRTKLYIYTVTMIPDTRNIDVIEIASNKKIGTLNEEYVVLNISNGDSLVLAGSTWKVVEYDSETGRLYVEGIESEHELVIPHWEGENIPVEYKIAREVGSIIRRIKRGDRIYFYDFAKDLLESIKEKARFFGDDKNIIIDYNTELNLLTINIFGGSRVNRFLKDLLKTLIENRYPFIEVRGYSTPYAVFINFGKKLQPHIVDDLLDLVEKTLYNLKEYTRVSVVREIASSQNTLYWRIYQVAQRFGALNPRSGPVSRSILAGFIDTVIGYEALKEVIHKDYDLSSVKEIAEGISVGRIKVVKRISDRVDDYHHELLGYIEIPQVSILRPFDETLYREKVLNRRITIICINCGYTMRGKVGEFLDKRIRFCPKCGRPTLAVVKGDGSREKEVVDKVLKGIRLDREESKIFEDLRRRAILLLTHGDLALIALSARGVGTHDVARIVSRVRSGENIYKILYEYEKRAIKAKKYLAKKH